MKRTNRQLANCLGAIALNHVTLSDEAREELYEAARRLRDIPDDH